MKFMGPFDPLRPDCDFAHFLFFGLVRFDFGRYVWAVDRGESRGPNPALGPLQKGFIAVSKFTYGLTIRLFNLFFPFGMDDRVRGPRP